MKSVAELKSSIVQSVSATDDQLILIEIEFFIRQRLSEKKSVVGYDSKGRALDIGEYQATIEEARQQYFSRKVITQQQMEDNA